MLIGLGHYSRVGKNYFANKFVQQLTNTTFSIDSFAWTVKDYSEKLYGYKGLQYPEFYETPEGQLLKHQVIDGLGKTPVQIWCSVGDDARKIDPNVWIEKYDKYSRWAKFKFNIVVDVRYHNEAEYIRSKGGILIKITREGIEPLDTPADTALLNYNLWDYEIENTDENFDFWISEILKKINKGMI